MTSYAPLAALVLFMLASVGVGLAANRAAKGKFLESYFLGNRSLGSWSMALTATVMSGGTFMGFPSLVYKYGWSLSLWIASYMMVPLCTFAVIGKRLGRLSRETGAVTFPDLLRVRFGSPLLGGLASGVMVFILSVSLVAQFKAGALILQQVLPPIDGVTNASWRVGDQTPAFVIGLAVFTLVVVSYTVIGGFLAAVWTDVFQSILMAVGVLILFPLAMIQSGGLAAGTAAGVQAVGPSFAMAPGGGFEREFLPLSLVFSFFCMWSIAGMGQPATLVRLMAYEDTQTLRRATGMLAVYNTLIYIPLLLTFICARNILPGLEKSDEVMPRLAGAVANPWVAGIILAAPFGAVMATVSAFLVQISSAIVQDFYHRLFRPNATERQMRMTSHLAIVTIAVVTALATLRSPALLQAIIVFAGGANACAFLFPAVMAAYMKGATARGVIASMAGGAGTVVLLYLIGVLRNEDPLIGEASKFYPVYLFGVAPFVWGLLVSVVLGIGVSRLDRRRLNTDC